jgi:hypothetical protein
MLKTILATKGGGKGASNVVFVHSYSPNSSSSNHRVSSKVTLVFTFIDRGLVTARFLNSQ